MVVTPGTATSPKSTAVDVATNRVSTVLILVKGGTATTILNINVSAVGAGVVGSVVVGKGATLYDACGFFVTRCLVGTAVVGRTVCLEVRVPLGAIAGCFDGLFVGRFVGFPVGRRVGLLLGPLVGLKLGRCEGR